MSKERRGPIRKTSRRLSPRSTRPTSRSVRRASAAATSNFHGDLGGFDYTIVCWERKDHHLCRRRQQHIQLGSGNINLRLGSGSNVVTVQNGVVRLTSGGNTASFLGKGSGTVKVRWNRKQRVATFPPSTTPTSSATARWSRHGPSQDLRGLVRLPVVASVVEYWPAQRQRRGRIPAC